MLKKIVLFLGLVIFLCAPTAAQVEKSFQLITANKINRNLAVQFPIDKSFQGTLATFTEAKVLINTLDQSVKLQMSASINDNQQHLLSTLIFDGDMQYDEFSESYVFENLRLDRFKIEQDSFSDSQEVVKVLKQSLINDFDDIMLFSLGEFNSLSFRRKADDIEIYLGKLRLKWN